MLEIFIRKRNGLTIGLIVSLLLALYHLLFIKGGMMSRGISYEPKVLFALVTIVSGMTSGYLIQHCLINRSSSMGGKLVCISTSILISPFSLTAGYPTGVLIAACSAGLLSNVDAGIYFYFKYVIFILGTLASILIIECTGAIIGLFMGSLVQRLYRI